jgi:flagellar motility protein MotE (MotC chaperone)
MNTKIDDPVKSRRQSKSLKLNEQAGRCADGRTGFFARPARITMAVLAVLALGLAAPCHGEDKPVRASTAEVNVATSLKVREEAVAAREQELDRRARELALIQQDVDAKIAEMLALQKTITEKLAEVRAEQDVEFKNLIKVYSTMSASKVAPLLNEMEDGNVTKILRAMKFDLVAKIIPKLEPDKAVRVSALLGRINESSVNP